MEKRSALPVFVGAVVVKSQESESDFEIELVAALSDEDWCSEILRVASRICDLQKIFESVIADIENFLLRGREDALDSYENSTSISCGISVPLSKDELDEILNPIVFPLDCDGPVPAPEILKAYVVVKRLLNGVDTTKADIEFIHQWLAPKIESLHAIYRGLLPIPISFEKVETCVRELRIKNGRMPCAIAFSSQKVAFGRIQNKWDVELLSMFEESGLSSKFFQKVSNMDSNGLDEKLRDLYSEILAELKISDPKDKLDLVRISKELRILLHLDGTRNGVLTEEILSMVNQLSSGTNLFKFENVFLQAKHFLKTNKWVEYVEPLNDLEVVEKGTGTRRNMLDIEKFNVAAEKLFNSLYHEAKFAGSVEASRELLAQTLFSMPYSELIPRLGSKD